MNYFEEAANWLNPASDRRSVIAEDFLKTLNDMKYSNSLKDEIYAAYNEIEDENIDEDDIFDAVNELLKVMPAHKITTLDIKRQATGVDAVKKKRGVNESEDFVANRFNALLQLNKDLEKAKNTLKSSFPDVSKGISMLEKAIESAVKKMEK